MTCVSDPATGPVGPVGPDGPEAPVPPPPPPLVPPPTDPNTVGMVPIADPPNIWLDAIPTYILILTPAFSSRCFYRI